MSRRLAQICAVSTPTSEPAVLHAGDAYCVRCHDLECRPGASAESGPVVNPEIPSRRGFGLRALHSLVIDGRRLVRGSCFEACAAGADRLIRARQAVLVDDTDLLRLFRAVQRDGSPIAAVHGWGKT
jgi:hypothetical protein